MPADLDTEAQVLVEIDPARARVEEIMGAVEAALRSDLSLAGVRIALDPSDPRGQVLEQLCGADPRVTVGTPTAAAAEDVVVTMPPSARPDPGTLPALVTLLRGQGLAAVEVPVPGRRERFARLARRGRLRASADGSGTRSLAPAEVGLRSTASRRQPGPPAKTALAHERAEHLRHRARSATMRARMDRNAQRLYRERLQMRHERSRLRLAEQRLASTGRGEWLRWRARGAARRARAVPAAVRSALASIRVFVRRGRRFALRRLRRRRAKG